jgi:acyl-CoA thioester hydrolase
VSGGSGGCHGPKVCEVLLIHGDHELSLGEPRGLHLPSAVIKWVAVRMQGRHRSWICRGTHMPRAGACGVNEHSVGEPCRSAMGEHCLRHGRAADVAQAYEQDAMNAVDASLVTGHGAHGGIWASGASVSAMRHTFPCQVRWSDLDAFGHVNNVVFHTYLQEARVDFLFRHAASLGAGGMSEGVVIARQEIDHTAPLEFTSRPMWVETWVSHIGGASFTLDYEVRDEDTVYARAKSICVAYELATKSARRLTEAERGMLANYLEPSAQI